MSVVLSIWDVFLLICLLDPERSKLMGVVTESGGEGAPRDSKNASSYADDVATFPGRKCGWYCMMWVLAWIFLSIMLCGFPVY